MLATTTCLLPFQEVSKNAVEEELAPWTKQLEGEISKGVKSSSSAKTMAKLDVLLKLPPFEAQAILYSEPI